MSNKMKSLNFHDSNLFLKLSIKFDRTLELHTLAYTRVRNYSYGIVVIIFTK